MPDITTIDPAAVHDALRDSFFRDDEIEGDQPPDSAVMVPGIVATFGFHPERLESHRSEVAHWLSLLPHGFRAEVGGGWSFLMACDQEDGTQWTGLHQDMEALFALGIGLGLASWGLPRELWSALPGGMPYVTIRLQPEEQS